jgi:hypothetical protein
MLRIFSIPPAAGPDKKRRLIRLLVKIKTDNTTAVMIILIRIEIKMANHYKTKQMLWFLKFSSTNISSGFSGQPFYYFT